MTRARGRLAIHFIGREARDQGWAVRLDTLDPRAFLGQRLAGPPQGVVGVAGMKDALLPNPIDAQQKGIYPCQAAVIFLI